MREDTPQPQPPAPVPRQQTQQPHPWPQTLETHLLGGLEFLGLVTPQKPHPVVPTLREPEAAGNTSDVDLHQEQLSELAGGDSLPDLIVPDVRLPGARLDGSVGEEWTSPRIAVEAMFVAFRLGLGSCHVRFLCSNEFISGIHYYTHREVLESLRGYYLYRFCIGFILFMVLWDIAHAAFLQLLVCKKPPCDGVEAQ